MNCGPGMPEYGIHRYPDKGEDQFILVTIAGPGMALEGGREEEW